MLKCTSRQATIQIWLIYMVILIGLLTGCREVPDHDGVNVILLTMDTTRADYIGAYGNPWIYTPNLDRFCQQFLQYKTCYTTSNGTNPAHASIFTSLPCKEHKLYDNSYPLNRRFKTIQEYLSTVGYNTSAAVSAFHLNPDVSGFGQGFVNFYVCRKNEQSSEKTIAVVEKNKLEILNFPFFLWIHLFDPHGLYTPKPPYDRFYYSGDPTQPGDVSVEKIQIHPKLRQRFLDWIGDVKDLEYLTMLYAAEITYMDNAIGQLFQLLKRENVWDNTAIICVADHGEALGEGQFYFNHVTTFDPVSTVPLMLKVPGTSPNQSLIRNLVSILDITPTIFALTDFPHFEPIRGQPLPLKNVGPKNNTLTDRTHYCEEGLKKGYMIRQTRYKYFEMYGKKKYLFDLMRDPAEKSNLIYIESDIATDMEQQLNIWLGGTDATPLKQSNDKRTTERLKQLGYVIE